MEKYHPKTIIAIKSLESKTYLSRKDKLHLEQLHKERDSDRWIVNMEGFRTKEDTLIEKLDQEQANFEQYKNSVRHPWRCELEILNYRTKLGLETK